MLPTAPGMQFLTNAFFLPYLATRPSEDLEHGVVVALDESSAHRKSSGVAGPAHFARRRRRGCGVVVLQRATEVGGFDERLGLAAQLLAGDRLGSSFLVDLGLYALFQSRLIPDDLKRRGVALDSDRAVPAETRIRAVRGSHHLLLRPRYPGGRGIAVCVFCRVRGKRERASGETGSETREEACLHRRTPQRLSARRCGVFLSRGVGFGAWGTESASESAP